MVEVHFVRSTVGIPGSESSGPSTTAASLTGARAEGSGAAGRRRSADINRRASSHLSVSRDRSHWGEGRRKSPIRDDVKWLFSPYNNILFSAEN